MNFSCYPSKAFIMFSPEGRSLLCDQCNHAVEWKVTFIACSVVRLHAKTTLGDSRSHAIFFVSQRSKQELGHGSKIFQGFWRFAFACRNLAFHKLHSNNRSKSVSLSKYVRQDASWLSAPLFFSFLLKHSVLLEESLEISH